MVINNDSAARARAILRFGVSAGLILVAAACVPPNAVPGPPWKDPGFNDFPERNAAAFNRYLNGFNSHWDADGKEVSVTLHCDTCSPNGVVLKFLLHESTYDIDPQQIVAGAPGHIVARISNDNGETYPPFNLTPNDKVAFLWIGKTRDHGVAFAIYQKGRNGPEGKAVAYRGSKCDDAHYPAERVHEGYDCLPGHSHEAYNRDDRVRAKSGSGVSQLISNVLRSRSMPSLARGGDLWFSCSGGCCQADSWALY